MKNVIAFEQDAEQIKKFSEKKKRLIIDNITIVQGELAGDLSELDEQRGKIDCVMVN